MRSGRKSASQTPAPLKDRIYGSKKNKEGSASSDKSAKSIILSAETLIGLKNKLKFDKHYGTPEVPAGGLPARIVNVLDADMVLDAMINTPQYKIYSDLIYSDPKWSKLGDLHVYSDGRPMNFVPTTYKIS